MLRAYSTRVSEMQDFYNSEHPKLATFKALVFSLCLFYSVLIERRKFGPLGFNIPYEFTDGDLKICMSQLHMFLLEYAETPYKVMMIIEMLVLKILKFDGTRNRVNHNLYFF